jgi:cephalosporin hydroxylase
MASIELGSFRPNRTRRRLLPYQQFVLNAFHRLYYKSWKRGARHGRSPGTLSIHWLGYEMIKCPLDLWIYQEMLVERRPDWVIETGTYRGGSALFLASVMDMIGHGRVLTVDVEPREGRPQHERIHYLTGSSTAPDVLAEIRSAVGPGERCIVILDSDHSEAHVAQELRLYREFVAVDDYMIVEDSNVNGHPVFPKFGPGPMEALRGFLREDARFQTDIGMERFLLTMNPSGYLRRVA